MASAFCLVMTASSFSAARAESSPRKSTSAKLRPKRYSYAGGSAGAFSGGFEVDKAQLEKANSSIVKVMLAKGR